MLVMDNFSAHKDIDVCAKLQKENVEPKFLPPNTTPILQPLDVLVNRAFKSRVTLLYEHWQLTLYEKYPELRNTLRVPIPDRQTIAKFIIWAWQSIPVQMIKKSFQRAGLFDQENFNEEEEDEPFRVENFEEWMPDPKNLELLLPGEESIEEVEEEEETN